MENQWAFFIKRIHQTKAPFEKVECDLTNPVVNSTGNFEKFKWIFSQL